MIPYIVIHVFAVLMLMRFLLYVFKRNLDQGKLRLEDKHVVVTGGSSGIGKEIALLASKSGANVTLIARNVGKLLECLEELQAVSINKRQVFKYISLDCSDWKQTKELLESLDELSPIYMLVNCAGFAKAGKFEELDESDYEEMLRVNVLGTVYPTKAVVGCMRKRKDGIVIVCGSMCSLFGLYGYTAYAASKFALRGFAESLAMELRPDNIQVTFAVPPDTETPGFKVENETKPIETLKISEMGGLYSPVIVAKRIVHDALDGKFFSSIGISGKYMTALCSGMAPVSSFTGLFLEFFGLGYCRLLAVLYLVLFRRTIKICQMEKKIK